MNTATAPRSVLTPDQVAEYHRDGFVIVPGLYTAEQMREWKRTLQETLAAEAKASKAQEEYVAKSGVRVWHSGELPALLLAAMKDEHVTPILKQIIGSDVEFLSGKAVFKDGTRDFASPWHQDWFYWEGATKTSVWIALDDATVANGCLMFVAGSHKKIFDKKVAVGTVFENRIDDKDIEGLKVVTCEVKTGDAVFFHDLAVHSSYPNTSKRDRWSFISTYRNAAVKDQCGLNENLWKEPMLVSGRSVNGGRGR